MPEKDDISGASWEVLNGTVHCEENRQACKGGQKRAWHRKGKCDKMVHDGKIQ